MQMNPPKWDSPKWDSPKQNPSKRDAPVEIPIRKTLLQRLLQMQTQYVEVGVFWRFPYQKKFSQNDVLEKDVALQKTCLDLISQTKEASHTVSFVGLVPFQKRFSPNERLKDRLQKILWERLSKHLHLR